MLYFYIGIIIILLVLVPIVFVREWRKSKRGFWIQMLLALIFTAAAVAFMYFTYTSTLNDLAARVR